MQVYLPDEVYPAVKDYGLGASGLLRKAVRAERRRHELLEEVDGYLRDLGGICDSTGETRAWRSDGRSFIPIHVLIVPQSAPKEANMTDNRTRGASKPRLIREPRRRVLSDERNGGSGLVQRGRQFDITGSEVVRAGETDLPKRRNCAPVRPLC